MSATPMTDAQLLEWHRTQGHVAGPKGTVVLADFARGLEGALARVTAERDEAQNDRDKLAAKLANLAKERSDVTDEYLALRSRNDELAKQLDVALAREDEHLATVSRLYQHNAELERNLADIAEIWGREITDYLTARADGRARAESGTPGKTDQVEQWCAEVEASLTPATHPDTYRLDWLADVDTYQRLHAVRVALPIAGYPTGTANDNIRAAIDAAMQGGAK